MTGSSDRRMFNLDVGHERVLKGRLNFKFCGRECLVIIRKESTGNNPRDESICGRGGLVVRSIGRRGRVRGMAEVGRLGLKGW